MLKQVVKKALGWVADAMARTRTGAYFSDRLLQSGLGRSMTVSHGGVTLELHHPNSLLTMRAETFSDKEPETLEWIDGFATGSLLWDIGANVGLYSLYAAKARNCRVVAFEPSVFNLEWLARNVSKNNLEDFVQMVPVALSGKNGFQMLNFSTTDWGGANTHFGDRDTAPPDRRYEALKYQTMGLNPDSMVASGMVPAPDHIKIDVDGIEHLILGAMPNALKSAQSLLVEVDTAVPGQDEACAKILRDTGLKLRGKNITIGAETGRKPSTSPENQIWIRG